MPLTDAPYMYPHDLGHAFVPGLTAIDGGKMDGFNCVTYGDDLTGYTQFDRKTLPAYWALADRFMLADHFFTSMYGPTFPEHLYTIAAQSYGIVDNKTTAPSPAPAATATIPTEHTHRFPIEDLTNAGRQERSWASRTTSWTDPANLFKIAAYWVDTRTCVNIPVLPDELEQNARQLEVLRDARHLDERDAGDQARAVRPDVEQGAGPRDDPDRPAERPACPRCRG